MLRFPVFVILSLATQIVGAEPTINRLPTVPSMISPGWEVHDFNSDALPDLITIPQYYVGKDLYFVIENLGNRSFAAPQNFYYPKFNTEMSTGSPRLIELEGPGDVHFFFNETRTSLVSGGNSYVSETLPVTVSLEKPNTFGTRVPLHPAVASEWLPVDLDADHRSEFVYTTRISDTEGNFTIMDRQPDGSYQSLVIPLTAGFVATEATAVDLDGDHDLDLILHDYNTLHILRRTGARTFELLPATQYVGSLKIEDLDGDGLPDFHNSEAMFFQWIRNAGGLNFETIRSIDVLPAQSSGYSFLRSEPQESGPATLVFAKAAGPQIFLKSVTFGTWAITSELTVDASVLNAVPSSYPGPFSNEGPSCEPLTTGDFDKDGHTDFVFRVFNRTAPAAGQYAGQLYGRLAISWGSAAGFEAPVFLQPSPISGKTMLVENFNHQPLPDLITGPDLDGVYWFFANSGTGTFPTPTHIAALDVPPGLPANTEVSGVHAGDLDGDGVLDLAIEYTLSFLGDTKSACGIAKGRGDGTFETPVLPAGSFGVLAYGSNKIDHLIDWDGDGDLDAISNGNWRENLGGQFSTEIFPLIDGVYLTDIFGNPVTAVFTRVGDVDGDGHPDIISLIHRIIENPFPSDPPKPKETVFAIGFNDGHGSIANIVEVPVTLYTDDIFGDHIINDLQIADLNADGRPDLCYHENVGTDLFGNPLTKSVWLRNPGDFWARNPNTWTKLPLKSSALPDSPNPKLDFDGDGRRDWVSLTGYTRPTPLGPAISAGYDLSEGVISHLYQISIYPADFDGDGDADFFCVDDLFNYSILTNPLVNSPGAITRHLVAAGAPGQKAGPASDADGDGRDNETELLFGTDPLTPDAAPANPLQVELAVQSAEASLRYRVPGYAAQLKLGYRIEHSTNLLDWAPLNGPAPVSLMNADGWNTLSLSVNCSAHCGYYRIRGVRLPE